SQVSPALRPLWILLHTLLLALGLWMLIVGRQPAWMGSLGRSRQVPGAIAFVPLPRTAPATPSTQEGWLPQHRQPHLLRAGGAGALWFAWPCGLLQSALLVSSLTGQAVAGAAAMAAFAVASSGGLMLAPWVWANLKRRGHVQAGRAERTLVRVGGGLMAAAATFALGQGIWHQVAALCGWN
ncbi:MAG: sulfite exporter TauE/SafE family protein, partial [Rhizobacter sp.]